MNNYTRAEELLLACKQLMDILENSPYILNAFEQEVHYDGSDCDGHCLYNDIKDYFEYEGKKDETKIG